jgi:chromosome partitioning protein
MESSKKITRSITTFCEETGLNYERVKSYLKYHGIKPEKIKEHGRPPVNALTVEVENQVISHLAVIDARKGRNKNKTKTIAVINQKGGVGKTTSTINLAAGLALEGYSVCVVDADCQASVTISLFGKEVGDGMSVMDAMTGSKKGRDIIKKYEKFDVLPANISMSNADIILNQEVGREYLLRDVIEQMSYDYVIIDAPPTLGLMSINAMVGSDYVLFPMKAEGLSLMGLNQLINVYKMIKKKANPNVNILGAFFADHHGGTNLSEGATEYIGSVFKDKQFKTTIRHNVKVAEAPQFHKDIFSHDPSSNGAVDYKALTNEVLVRINN